MSRQPRPHLPGGAFHITARTHRKERWFVDDVRTEIVRLIPDAVARVDARLLGYVVMPNHFHLIVWQGRDPLWRLLQPLLRRVAHRVQRAHGFEGTVFGGRYHAFCCADPEYLRNSIVYTHLNPVRAGLCADPSEYAWSSHKSFCSTDPQRDATPWLRVEDALSLFARTVGAAASQHVSDYDAFVRWRIAADSHRLASENGTASSPAPDRPRTVGGNAHWLGKFRGYDDIARTHLPTVRRADVRDIAQRVLAVLAAGCDIGAILGRSGGRAGARLRREISRRAAAEGYRNRQIAQFLMISESRVSRLVAGVARH